MKTQSSSQGFVLVVVLIFLIVATVLGISSIQRTILQERIAGGERERQLAFQAAELALRDAERDLLELDNNNAVCVTCRPEEFGRDPNNPFVNQSNSIPTAIALGDGDCNKGICRDLNPDKTISPARTDWVGYQKRVAYGTYTNAAAQWNFPRTGAQPGGGKLRLPAYIVEYLGRYQSGGSTSGGSPVYRITAWGWDSSADSATTNPPAPTVTLQEVFVVSENY